MVHLSLQPYARRKRHPGSTRAGNIGFYSVLGITLIVLLILSGVYILAQDALQGLASMLAAK
jgi:hypothetical protein